MSGGLYLDLGVATEAGATIYLTDTAHGRRQREIPELGSMKPRESITEGAGLHGATAYRISYAPFVQPVDVDIFATWGTTDEQKNVSYQQNLARTYAIFAGRATWVGRYGGGTIVKCAAIGQAPFQIVEALENGNTHRINFLVLEFVRGVETVTDDWASLADPEVLDLHKFACSAPLVRTFWTITGPSDPLMIEPLEPHAGVAAYGSLIYDKALDSGEILTIDTDYRADPVLTSSIPANLDYRALSNPGNSSNRLEIPPGWSSGSADDRPRVRVTGGPAAVSVSSVLAFLGF